jgi:mono/diheme cytochrome c family protein
MQGADITELSMKIPSRRLWVRAGLVLVLAFGAIQFVPYGRDHVNPPVGVEPVWDSSSTRALAKQACFDCHSNETEWPAYSMIAPVSWVIQRDVSEGRAVLNFSEWQRPQEEAKEAAEEVREGEMPLAMYQLMHAHSRLSAPDRERLARGLERTLGRSVAAARDDR